MSDHINTHPDLCLVRQFLTGDPDAFDLIHRRINRLVSAACWRYGQPDHEDATQAAWLRILQHLGQYAGAAPLTTWAYRVAYSCCRDRRRATTKRPVTEWADLDTAFPRPQHDLASLPATMLVRQALARLPAAHRTALVSHSLAGLPVREIARQAGRSENCVKTHLFRARRELREALRRLDR